MRAWCTAAALAASVAIAAAGQGVPPEPAGLTVALLLDVTASVSRFALPIDQRYAQAFNAFLLGLKPSDRGVVGVIAGRVHFSKVTGDHRELTSNLRVLLQVPEADRMGPSPLWDSVDEALGFIDDPSGRPAVILVSDGKSNGGLLALQQVIDHARRIHASFSAVVEGPGAVYLSRAGGAAETLDPADLVEQFTHATGGLRLLDRPTDPRQRNPGPLVAQIMDVLHASRGGGGQAR
jgi:hypothetical protein